MHLLIKFFTAFLLNANTPENPEISISQTFDVSFYVKQNQQIQVAVDKYSDERLWLILYNERHQAVFEHEIPKEEKVFRAALTVDNLTEGKYEMVVLSKQRSVNRMLTIARKPIQTVAHVLSLQQM